MDDFNTLTKSKFNNLIVEQLKENRTNIYDSSNNVISILKQLGFKDEELASMYYDFMRGVMKFNRIFRSLDDSLR